MGIDCFQISYMKMNFDKYHLLAAGHKFEPILAKVGSDIIWESNSVKLKSDKLLIVSLHLTIALQFYVLVQIKKLSAIATIT